MRKIKIPVKQLSNHPKPAEEFSFKPALEHDAGIDLFSAQSLTIPSHRRRAIATGVAVNIPTGYFGKLYEKSGVSVKTPLSVIAGVIDSGYTGEIMVVLQNDSPDPWPVQKGEKIAQIIFHQLVPIEAIQVSEFEDTERGSSGFGSTN